jgi:thiol-disulfide isomerase/thioredoxin
MDEDLILILIAIGFTILVVRNYLREEFNPPEERIVYLFYAKWCAASQRMLSIWNRINQHKHKNLVMQKIDIDENKEMAKLYNIKFLPTIICVINGKRRTLPSNKNKYADVHNFIDRECDR